MQAPQNALGGTALVVLHKGLVDAGGGERLLMVGLHKITAVIAKDGGFDDDNAGKLGGNEIEFAHDTFLLIHI